MIRPLIAPRGLLALAAGVLAWSACGSDDDAASSSDLPTVVVTTNILGDVVDEVVGDQAEVIAVMPVGADPHDFQASAREVDRMVSADALIVNGAGFEEGLLDVVENAGDEGVPIHEAIDAVDALAIGAGGRNHDDDHDGDDDQADDEHDGDGDEHDHDGIDPHFFTDPVRMADAVDGIVEFLIAEVDGVDDVALRAAADTYLAALADLDTEVDTLVSSIPEARRVLVTNHEVFGYFADRYGFEVVGAIIPGGGTTDGVSPAELVDLADTIRAERVPAIFADESSSDELVETLADEVGDEIEIVELYSESLGEPGSDGATYLDMVRTDAERIAAALG